MSDFLVQDEQLEMLPARTQLTTWGFVGNGGNGGDGGSADGGKAIATGGSSNGLINVNVLSGNAYASADGGHGGHGGDGGNGHYSSSTEYKSWGGGKDWGHCHK